jgi:hypothetical protein
LNWLTNNFASIVFIMNELPRNNISDVTFSRRLREHGLHFRFAARKKRITPIVANERIATECLNYDGRFNSAILSVQFCNYLASHGRALS